MKTVKTTPEDSSQLRRILVPVDFSKLSLNALPHAVAFARRCEAQLILLHAST